MTDHTETARHLLDRHGLPEDVIDGALTLHIQEVTALVRAEADKPRQLIESRMARNVRRIRYRQVADLIEAAALGVPLAAAPAVSPPAVDRAALRDRIAEALVGWAYRGKAPKDGGILETVRANAYSRADAVLAVLPAPADRAAVLDEAERTMLTYALNQAQLRMWSTGKYTDEEQAALVSLRRMAAETQPAEARCGCPHPEGEHSVYGCADGCGCEWMPKRPPMDPVHILGIEAPRCDVEFEGGGTCTKAAGHRTPQNQDPHTPPAVGAQQPKEARS